MSIVKNTDEYSNMIKLLKSHSILRYQDKVYLSWIGIMKYEFLSGEKYERDLTNDEKEFVDFYDNDIDTNNEFINFYRSNMHFCPAYKDESKKDNGLFHSYIKEKLEDIIDGEIFEYIFTIQIKILVFNYYISCFGDFYHNYDVSMVEKQLNIYLEYYDKIKNYYEDTFEISNYNDVIYKLVGNETNIFDYCDNHTTDKYGDWTGFYFQLSQEHSLESLGYRYDKKYETANLLKIKIENAKVVKIKNNKYLPNKFLCEDKKAQYIKFILNLDYEKVLLPNLDYDAIIIEERENLFEFVIPQHKIKNIIQSNYSQKIIASYKTTDIFKI